MEEFGIITAIIILIIAVLSLMYKPNTAGWIELKKMARKRFDNYEGENKELIEEHIEEIAYWCEILYARRSYFMAHSNSIVANRIVHLHSELIILGFFDDEIDRIKGAIEKNAY